METEKRGFAGLPNLPLTISVRRETSKEVSLINPMGKKNQRGATVIM